MMERKKRTRYTLCGCIFVDARGWDVKKKNVEVKVKKETMNKSEFEIFLGFATMHTIQHNKTVLSHEAAEQYNSKCIHISNCSPGNFRTVVRIYFSRLFRLHFNKF